jgi:hypothetical protein
MGTLGEYISDWGIGRIRTSKRHQGTIVEDQTMKPALDECGSMEKS